jgi:hypothetical protein
MPVAVNKLKWQFFTHYPYLITRGHLNNFYRDKDHREFCSFPASEKDTPMTLCVKAIIITKEAYDFYWTKLSKKLDTPSYPFYYLMDPVDLICNITVIGGSYASFNNISLQWSNKEQIWKLPEYTDKNPLFAVHGTLTIQTDGEYLCCWVGAIGPRDLRLELAKASTTVTHDC